MSKKLTNEDFIKKAKIVHGDTYDYSKINYLNSHIKITIICNIHGTFEQLPYHHLNGSNCPKCKNRDVVTNERFIEKAILIHGNIYDYSKINYVNNYSKILIICKKHGEFFQSPNSHLSGQMCPKCKIDNLIIRNTKSNEYFINKANKIHNFKYEYPNFNIKNKKIDILCKIHGIFKQYLTHHLQGSGCPKCSNVYKYTTADFIILANKIHNSKYLYSLSNYINGKTKITIICPRHGPFEQTPGSHLRGRGCPKCTSKISKPEIEFLNYLNIKEENRHFRIKPYNIDGYDPNTNTVYEFLGDFYHGNPEVFKSTDYNKICHKTFGELYNKTIMKFENLLKLGYNIKYVWEHDWNKFKKNINKNLIINTFMK